jgi:excinuclease UvrABC ATPase subunit
MEQEEDIRFYVPTFSGNPLKGVCPSCGGHGLFTQYIDYSDLPEEEYCCEKCGKNFYRVLLFAKTTTKPCGLWNNQDYIELLQSAITLANEKLKHFKENREEGGK